MGCSCSVTRSRHASPRAPAAARAFVALIALVLGIARPGRAAGRRRRRRRPWRRASSSAGTPGSGRGSRSPSTSPTTARRSPASSASPEARRARRGSGRPVDLPTQADKTYVLYAQPPTFGSELKVDLVRGRPTIATSKAPFTIHDASQLVVAVVAEHPERIVGSIDLPPNMNQVAPLILNLTPDDLPERVEAWTSIDRIVWQDTEADRLSPAQLAAMRGWLAGGGRLVIAGGTVGPAALAAFPDAILPFRPVVTTDVPADEPDRTARRAADGRDHAARPCRASSSRAGRSRRPATASSPPSGRTARAR